MSALQTLAKPRRIKASHRRRWKSASGQSVQRYYDPQIGRFLSVDPVSAYSKKGILFNRYGYANDNPYRFTDPDGRVAFEYNMSRADKVKYRDQIKQFEKSAKKTEKSLVASNSPVAAKFVATTFVVSSGPLPANVAAKAGPNAGNVMGYEVSPGDNKTNLTPAIFNLGDPKAKTDSYFGRPIGAGSESNLAFGYLHEWRHDFPENAKYFESGDPAGGEREANQFAEGLLPTVMEEKK